MKHPSKKSQETFEQFLEEKIGQLPADVQDEVRTNAEIATLAFMTADVPPSSNVAQALHILADGVDYWLTTEDGKAFTETQRRAA